jgi:thiamine-monophosphate kinase
VLGSVDEPRPRNAARIGDEVWLVGDVGLAAAGLLLLQRRGSRAPRGRLSLPANECITAWREPRALIERGQKLGSRARALIDISDGLANEAGHLGRASRVRIVLSGPRLRNAAKPELCAVAAQLGKDPLELMLYGGEDYALLATGPSASRPRWAICVGSVKAGAGAWLERELGTKPERLRSGFDHLAQ